LINALCRRQIARTSAAPGKTRLANVYRVTFEGSGPGRRELYLVDLPGYGYGRGGAEAARELGSVAEGYFARSKVPDPGQRRQPGSGTLLLVDSRHPRLDSDLGAFRWLESQGLNPLLVATKIDKLSRAERMKNLRDMEVAFGRAALPVSALRGEGLDELWRRLAKLVREVKEPR
jgi:GTP-binding protein